MRINEKDYKLDFTGYTLVVYKQEFKKDLLTQLASFSPDNFDIVMLLEIMWAMARSVKENNIDDYVDFVSSITDLGVLTSPETYKEIIEAVNKGMAQTKEIKKK